MRLNLGAGDWRPDGWVTVDVEDADVRHDLAVTPWPFADGAADAILASHILEHVTRDQAARFLAECARVLAPGGVLAIAVPDMDRFIDARLAGDDTPLDGYVWTNLNWLLGGGPMESRAHWRHQYMWCWGSLAWACQVAGLAPRRATFDDSAAPHQPAYRAISLYVDATKGGGR